MSGNPNPDMSGLTPFEKGKSGNPGGKTKEQRAAEVQSAEDSAKIRALMTAKLLKEMTAQDADPTKFIDPAVLKLLKDSEDRGHGTPVQAIHMSMEDDVRGKSDAEIDADIATIQKKLGIPQDDSDTAGS